MCNKKKFVNSKYSVVPSKVSKLEEAICFIFLSATEYFPSRTIIQAGWVSSLSLSSLWLFSRWDNLRTLWAIKLIFGMVTCNDYVLWIRIFKPILPMQTAQPAKSLFLVKKFHDGLTWPIFVRFGSNLVQRSFITL